MKINIEDFGVKGDNITDDTQAFKDAIALINQQSFTFGNLSYHGVGTIEVPSGCLNVFRNY